MRESGASPPDPVPFPYAPTQVHPPPDDYGLPGHDDAGDDYYDDEPAPPTLGPDERDRDLLDGSWEQRYYQGRVRSRDWNSVTVGIVLIVLIAMLLPMFLVFFQ